MRAYRNAAAAPGDLGNKRAVADQDEPQHSWSRRDFMAVSSTSLAGLQLGGSAQASAEPTAVRTSVSITSSERSISLLVNGTQRTISVEPRVTLLDAIRDRIGLTGTKKGCDQGTCGACTVLVNGRRIDSCLTLAVMHDGDTVTTIEGIAQSDRLHPVQSAFIRHDGFQCGYCTPGQIVSAVALLSEGHVLERDVVQREMSGNICRCGCYPHIVDAVLEAGSA
jgi:xanthine dehydrogenase YagT iron-sulfur-binding subunit